MLFPRCGSRRSVSEPSRQDPTQDTSTKLRLLMLCEATTQLSLNMQNTWLRCSPPVDGIFQGIHASDVRRCMAPRELNKVSLTLAAQAVQVAGDQGARDRPEMRAG